MSAPSRRSERSAARRAAARAAAPPLAGRRAQVLLLAAALVALYPVFFMVMTALKTHDQYLSNPYSLPWPLSFDNFGERHGGGSFLTWFKNSVDPHRRRRA